MADLGGWRAAAFLPAFGAGIGFICYSGIVPYCAMYEAPIDFVFGDSNADSDTIIGFHTAAINEILRPTPTATVTVTRTTTPVVALPDIPAEVREELAIAQASFAEIGSSLTQITMWFSFLLMGLDWLLCGQFFGIPTSYLVILVAFLCLLTILYTTQRVVARLHHWTTPPVKAWTTISHYLYELRELAMEASAFIRTQHTKAKAHVLTQRDLNRQIDSVRAQFRDGLNAVKESYERRGHELTVKTLVGASKVMVETAFARTPRRSVASSSSRRNTVLPRMRPVMDKADLNQLAKVIKEVQNSNNSFKWVQRSGISKVAEMETKLADFEAKFDQMAELIKSMEAEKTSTDLLRDFDATGQDMKQVAPVVASNVTLVEVERNNAIIAELKATNRYSISEIKTLTQEKGDLAQTNATLEQTLSEAQQEMIMKDAEISDIKSQLSSLQDSFDISASEIRSLSENFSGREGHITDLENEITASREEVAAKTTLASGYQAELLLLRGDSAAKVPKLEQDVTTTRKIRGQLATQLAESETKATRLSEDLAMARDETAQGSEEMERTRALMDELQEKADNAEASHGEVTEWYTEAEGKATVAEAAAKELQKELDALRLTHAAKTAGYESRIIELETALSSSRSGLTPLSKSKTADTPLAELIAATKKNSTDTAHSKNKATATKNNDDEPSEKIPGLKLEDSERGDGEESAGVASLSDELRALDDAGDSDAASTDKAKPLWTQDQLAAFSRLDNKATWPTSSKEVPLVGNADWPTFSTEISKTFEPLNNTTLPPPAATTSYIKTSTIADILQSAAKALAKQDPASVSENVTEGNDAAIATKAPEILTVKASDLASAAVEPATAKLEDSTTGKATETHEEPPKDIIVVQQAHENQMATSKWAVNTPKNNGKVQSESPLAMTPTTAPFNSLSSSRYAVAAPAGTTIPPTTSSTPANAVTRSKPLPVTTVTAGPSISASSPSNTPASNPFASSRHAPPTAANPSNPLVAPARVIFVPKAVSALEAMAIRNSAPNYLPVTLPHDFWSRTPEERSLFLRIPWSQIHSTTPQYFGKPAEAWGWALDPATSVWKKPAKPWSYAEAFDLWYEQDVCMVFCDEQGSCAELSGSCPEVSHNGKGGAYLHPTDPFFSEKVLDEIWTAEGKPVEEMKDEVDEPEKKPSLLPGGGAGWSKYMMTPEQLAAADAARAKADLGPENEGPTPPPSGPPTGPKNPGDPGNGSGDPENGTGGPGGKGGKSGKGGRDGPGGRGGSGIGKGGRGGPHRR